MSTNQATAIGNGLSKSERETLLMGVQKMISKEVTRAGIPKRHREDVEQELQMAVWASSEKFDPTRGVKFSTFAYSVMRNTLLMWQTKHRHEDGPGADMSIGDSSEFDGVMSRRVIPERGPYEDEDEPGSETMDSLTVAIRRSLTDGFLAELTPNQRELVEAVVFQGLSASQVAVQRGHPLKSVRTNLMAVVRKLCALGMADHVATPVEQAEATKAKIPMSAEERARHNASCRANARKKREAANGHKPREAPIVTQLKAVAGDDAFAARLRGLDDDMKVVVLSVIDGSFSVDQGAEALGITRNKVVRQLRKVAGVGSRKSVSAVQVAPSEALAV